MGTYHYFDELMERNAALSAENEKLRAQVAELLPWAWHHALTHRQGLSLLTRIEQGEFGETK